MRKMLKEIKEVRKTFTGTFERFGGKMGYKRPERTVLLVEIKDESDTIVTDHLWFNYTLGFQKLGLEKGDIVQFDARVQEYTKGYKGRRWGVDKPVEKDYRLTRPTKVKRLNNKL